MGRIQMVGPGLTTQFSSGNFVNSTWVRLDTTRTPMPYGFELHVKVKAGTSVTFQWRLEYTYGLTTEIGTVNITAGTVQQPTTQAIQEIVSTSVINADINNVHNITLNAVPEPADVVYRAFYPYDAYNRHRFARIRVRAIMAVGAFDIPNSLPDAAIFGIIESLPIFSEVQPFP